MKKNKKPASLFAAPEPSPPVAPGAFRMRLGAGKYALSAGEAEVHVDGARIAGGNGMFEFDLAIETWVDIKIIKA